MIELQNINFVKQNWSKVVNISDKLIYLVFKYRVIFLFSQWGVPVIQRDTFQNGYPPPFLSRDIWMTPKTKNKKNPVMLKFRITHTGPGHHQICFNKFIILVIFSHFYPRTADSIGQNLFFFNLGPAMHIFLAHYCKDNIPLSSFGPT